MLRSAMEPIALQTPREWDERKNYKTWSGTNSKRHIHSQKHTHQQTVPGFLSVQPLRMDAGGGGWGLFLVAGAEWRALSSSSNTVTWMFVPLFCLVITWFSPPSASAAAGAWHSSEPWSWRWKWQSSRPWPAPPSQTPTTASSHPGNPKLGATIIISITITQAYCNITVHDHINPGVTINILWILLSSSCIHDSSTWLENICWI